MEHAAPQFRAIASRRQAIRAEMAALRSQLDSLETENAELEIAAKVLQRLGLLAEEAGPELPLPSAPLGNEPKPTVPDMIRSAVFDHISVGLDGATSQMIILETARRWGVSNPNIVRPTIWRMVKDGRLIRSGDLYTLPKMPDGLLTGSEPISPISQGSGVSPNTGGRIVQ